MKSSVFLLSALPAAVACLVVVVFVREARSRPSPPVAAVAAPVVAILSRPLLGYLLATILFALGNSSDAFLLLRVHDAGLPA